MNARQFFRASHGRRFVLMFVSMLWDALRASGRGYRAPSLRHTGRGEDRRADKLEAAKTLEAKPLFTGRLNYRRSDPQHPHFVGGRA